MTIPEALLALSDSPGLSLLVKATIILALGLLMTHLAKRSSASFRHLILGVAFAALLVLPLVIAAIPRVGIEVPVHSEEATRASVATGPTVGDPYPVRLAPSPVHDDWSWNEIAGTAWIGGMMLQLFLVAWHLLRLHRIRRVGIPWLDRRDLVPASVDILLHEGIGAPITCCPWRPAILLPTDARDWSEAELQRAVTHELEHVRRRDWTTQVICRIAVACYWFHPLAWAAWRRLCLEAERAADDVVISRTECTGYAEQLVELARRMSHTQTHAALGMARRSDLSVRVSALLDSSQHRGRAGWLSVTGAIALAGVVLAAIAPLTAVAQSSGVQNAAASSRRVSVLDRALYEAAEAGEVEDIESLLKAGANVNAAIGGDGTPLIGAARKGEMAAVIRLLDRGADPNMSVTGDGNPLIMAAARGQVGVVSLLLDRGARIDEVVPGDENALIQASGNGHLNVVKLLISRRANVNVRLWVETDRRSEGEWRSPLSMARKGGHRQVVDFLMASGARE